MASVIIYDPDLNIAAVVDPDRPVALGPVAVGEEGSDPRDVLQEFVAALDGDPSTMTTWALFDEWANYIQAIVTLVEDQLARDAESAPAAPIPGQTDLVDELADAPEDAPQDAVDAVAEDQPPDASEPLTPEEERQQLAAIQDAPGTPAKRQEQDCWLCQGSGQIDGPAGVKVECPTCTGSGRLPIESGA